MDVLPKSERVIGVQLNRVMRASTLYLLGNIASRMLGFLAIPFYAHYLTPAQYGIIELIELSTQVVGITFGLQSIGAALTRLFHDQDTAEKERNIVSTSVIATGLLSGVIAAAAVLAAGPLSLAVFHSADHAPLLQAAFVAMWFGNMVEVILVYERIRERARFFFAYSMVSLVGNLGLNIYFIGFAGAGVWGFVYSKLITTGIGSAYLIWRALRDVGWHWRQEYIPALVRFGLPLCFASISAFFIHFSDRFFLADAVSLAELGRYALAYRFAFLVSVLVGESFGKSWNVTFYRLVNHEGWKESFAKVALYLNFALYLTGLSVSMMAPELLRLMVPTDFYPPYLLLPLLVIAYVFRECGDFFRNLLLINRRSGLVSKVVFSSALINGLLNFTLIPSFGIYGAAFATAGTWIVYMVVFWALAWSEHRVPISVLAFAKINILAIGIFALGGLHRAESPFLEVAINCLWIGLFVGLSLLFYFSSAHRRELLAIIAAQAQRLIRPPHHPVNEQTARLPAVLILAFYFSPENAIGAARPARFTKYLLRLGYPVSVVARWLDDAPDTTVTRVPAPRQNGAKAYSVSNLFWWFNRVALPYDDRLWWIPHAYAAASTMLRRNPRQVVLSTSPPLATHLAALALKLRHGCRWIADFRDPLTGNPVRSAQRALLIDPMIERMIFRHADAIIANTDAVLQTWQERYPQWKNKIHLIWNGFDPEDKLPPSPIGTQTRRTLAHVGTIYGGRTPEPLIASLDRLVTAGAVDADSIQLRLIGPIENRSLDLASPPSERLQALGCLYVADRMAPQTEARKETLDADFLLLIDIVDSEIPGLQLPAKIFDYIRACRPILAFTPAGSVITRVLALADIPHVCIPPTASIEDIDRGVLAFLGRERIEIRPSAAFWHDFDASSQTYVLANLISRITADSAPLAPRPQIPLPAAPEPVASTPPAG